MNNGLFSAAGNLYWYLHEGQQTGTQDWKGGLKSPVGIGGWEQYLNVFGGSDGVIYAVGADGNLYWYRHLGWQDGKVAWSERKLVGDGGWDYFTTIFGAGNGVIYAIGKDGNLYWYLHKGWQTGEPDWAERTVAGKGGWDYFNSVAAADNGVIYAVGGDGNLYWYLHKGYQTGAPDWAERTVAGKGGWDYFSSVLAVGDGIIYAVGADGNLYWYRHLGWQDGKPDWEPRTVVGEGGWLLYKTVFAINGKVLYAVGRDSMSWMGSVYSKLKGTALCALSLPGSHDAGAYPDIAVRSQAQGKDFPGQLSAGCRYFDCRVKAQSDTYYAVHGGDTTDHDYTALNKKPGKSYLLDEVANYLKAHKRELAILNFSHFVAFEPKDKRNFARLLLQDFGGLLVPRSRKATGTYGDCIKQGQQVVAIVEDDSEWYQFPANTPAGKQERENSWFWSWAECFMERYSDIYVDINVAPPIGDLNRAIEKTLKDQEEYLLEPQAGDKDHRDPSKFWVTQAVLNYAAVPHHGKSQNYFGAQAMNIKFTETYQNYWIAGEPSLKGHAGRKVLPPNVLLFDFIGYFDGFPDACVQMAINKR